MPTDDGAAIRQARTFGRGPTGGAHVGQGPLRGRRGSPGILVRSVFDRVVQLYKGFQSRRQPRASSELRGAARPTGSVLPMRRQ